MRALAAAAQLLPYVNGCVGKDVSYGQSLAGTAFGLPTAAGSCTFRGYTGWGMCCNGAYMGTSGPWLSGACTANALPASPIVSQWGAASSASSLACLGLSWAMYGRPIMAA